MPPPSRPSSRHRRGATRRRDLPVDRWLNRAIDIAVLAAVVIGGIALVMGVIGD